MFNKVKTQTERVRAKQEIFYRKKRTERKKERKFSLDPGFRIIIIRLFKFFAGKSSL
jgi:hypothetical protein